MIILCPAGRSGSQGSTSSVRVVTRSYLIIKLAVCVLLLVVVVLVLHWQKYYESA
jgi:hypothetical protein